jgi:two-component system, OmpR family, sensor histidine kinase KdpD
MTNTLERPDPDVLLRRLERDERRARRGALKVFFGFAPGVGKTYRMLQVAHELARERTDVVIGVVEDHRRVETARLVEGLERLPLRRVDYRGHVLQEFDLDAALARKPSLLLVDELAHTNAVGSRHTKRWQDVEELLEAGIDVFSTMNVQHVESLNDVVAQITHVEVKETVPDSVLDRADSVELVDITPEDLLERLRDGKVYLPDQARRAAEHFFRRGNLLALRELALRRTAQHVDDEVREYRSDHGVLAPWPAGERILVCFGPAPSSGKLLRAAARMAAGLRCPWIAAYVEASTSRPPTEVERTRIDAHARDAEALGASVVWLSGATISDTVLDYARRHNVTRLVLGKPTHPRVFDRLRGSLVDAIVRGSGDIDVHVIRGDDPPAKQSGGARGVGSAGGGASLGAYGFAAIGMVVVTALGLGIRALADLPDLEMLFLLAVMTTAVWFGRGPSLLAAVLGVASYDFFFVPPYLTFSVDDRRYFLTFAMMFVVSLAMSELAGRLRRQQRDARSREERTAVLYALTRELAAADDASAIATLGARHAAETFSADVWILNPGLGLLGVSTGSEDLDPQGRVVASWCLDHGALAGLGTDTLPGAGVLCAPLRAAGLTLGVLALAPRDGRPLGTRLREFLDVLCRQLALALARARLSDEARSSALRARTEEMRSALLSAVSHDLRTPLASITGAATTLLDSAKLSESTRQELTSAIVEEAERLERLVANLLDMTRLESGGVQLRREWMPLEEMIGSALTRLDARLGPRPVAVSIAPDVPLLHVDPVLFEQVFVNLLENAVKYTPPGSALTLAARRDADRVEIDVADVGPGLPPGDEARVFEKFYRGPQRSAPGVGLGLPICKGIVEAHGGTLRASNRAPSGAVFTISLPDAGLPPEPSSEAAS